MVLGISHCHFGETTLFLEDSAAPEDLEPASTAWSVVHSASREGRRAVCSRDRCVGVTGGFPGHGVPPKSSKSLGFVALKPWFWDPLSK